MLVRHRYPLGSYVHICPNFLLLRYEPLYHQLLWSTSVYDPLGHYLSAYIHEKTLLRFHIEKERCKGRFVEDLQTWLGMYLFLNFVKEMCYNQLYSDHFNFKLYCFHRGTLNLLDLTNLEFLPQLCGLIHIDHISRNFQYGSGLIFLLSI